jgi:hypothetical protein
VLSDFGKALFGGERSGVANGAATGATAIA